MMFAIKKRPQVIRDLIDLEPENPTLYLFTLSHLSITRD